jgi:hypothetical protein
MERMKVLKIKQLLAVLIVVSTLLLCSNDENNLPSPLIGKYELIEYKSEIELDLNADGMKSENILEELEELYFRDNNDIIPYDLSISDYFNVQMYIRLPGLNSLDDIPNGNTYGDSFPSYELNISEDLITVSDFELIPSEISYPSELEEMTFIEPNTIKLVSKQTFRCYVDNEYRRINTIATYRKLEL